MSGEAKAPASLSARLGHEARQYAIVVAYLWLCFAAILFYEGAVLRAEGIRVTLYGVAALKALILGKFLMVGQSLHVGEQFASRPLIHQLAYRSVLFALLLAAMIVVEETVVGWVHGRAIRESIGGIAGGNWRQAFATWLLLWLILVPYLAIRLISQALGEDRLRRMFFGTG
jgi:hypothetical protein